MLINSDNINSLTVAESEATGLIYFPALLDDIGNLDVAYYLHLG